MKISYVVEIMSDSPEEKICTVILYGVAYDNGEEIGRFVLDSRVLKENDYETYVDVENHSIQMMYIKEWEKQAVEPISEVIKSLEKDSVKNKK